ncbi:MAG: hypothetical protein ABSE36_07615 [Terracidiphilus sp.]
MSQSLGSIVKCLIGRIDGVSAIVLNGRIGGVEAGLDEDAEVDVTVTLSAIVRRRAPARTLGL